MEATVVPLTHPGELPLFLKTPPFAPISAIQHGRTPARVACWSVSFRRATAVRRSLVASSKSPSKANRWKIFIAPEPRPIWNRPWPHGFAGRSGKLNGSEASSRTRPWHSFWEALSHIPPIESPLNTEPFTQGDENHERRSRISSGSLVDL